MMPNCSFLPTSRHSGARPLQRLLLALTLFCVSCQPESKPAQPGQAVLFASVPPQAFLLKAIAGDNFKVHTLIAPGQDPHHWMPSPKQMLALNKGAAWWPAGLPFEQNLLPKIQATANGPQIFLPSAHPVAQHSNNHLDHKHHNDAHTWLSPPLLIQQGQDIAEQLGQLDPQHQQFYQNQALVLIKKITALDQQITQQLAPHQQRSFLIFHKALTHFADNYHLSQQVIQSGDASPDPKHLRSIIKQARQNHNTVIITQPQFDSQSAHMVAKAIGARIVIIDPLSEDVLANLKYIADTLSSDFSQSNP